MKWVTRHNPHVDRWYPSGSSNLHRPDAVFEFISNETPIPEGTTITLTGAKIKPKNGLTTFDVLVDKYNVIDVVVAKIQKIIRDAEQLRRLALTNWLSLLGSSLV